MVGGLPKELRSKGERGDEEQEGSFRLGSRVVEDFFFIPFPVSPHIVGESPLLFQPRMYENVS